jgi:uncharacterized protein YgbK (DUF1537 family)
VTARTSAGAAATTALRALDRPLVVLDDDPTGAQLLAGVPVLLEWDAPRIAQVLTGSPSVHLLTNSRALSATEARSVVASAAAKAAAGKPDAALVLRGDSTLRGHLLQEYLGLCDALTPSQTPPLLLVPALPSAGRVTVGGVHFIERRGERIPLHATEYATDGVFSYATARLLDWAEERSGGFFRAADGVSVSLDDLRGSHGARRVAAALAALADSGRPAVCAPDAETIADLAVVAAGVALAFEDDLPFFVRCAPALVGLLAGTTAAGIVPPPVADRVLVVCGSHVPTTTAQLARLEAKYPGTVVEVDLAACASDGDVEVERLADAASDLLAGGDLAVIATPRMRAETTLRAGERIARNLARAVGRVTPPPAVVVAKGGITSATILREGLAADGAEVVGPLMPGVSLWRPRTAPRGSGSDDYVVVPGNVGDDDLLVELVALLLGVGTPESDA